MSGLSGRARHAPNARRTPFIVLVLGLIAGGMFALLALNTASAANEVRRHDIADADQSVAAQVEQLQIDARNSAAPGNLARAAEALGMVPAGNPGFIEIGRKGAVRVLGRPAPATAVYLPPPAPTATPHRGTHRNDGQHTDKNKSKHPDSTGQRARGGKRDKQRPAGDGQHQQLTPTPTPTPTPTITLPGGDR